ncbi:transcriptional regulator [candidate division KSB1 bacterium 4572_119]|nr:MAG: transcriptional regulator [candidate division KSB1 bacterium 4572_119]
MKTNRRINVLIIEDEEFDVKRIEKTLKPFSNRIQIKDVVSNGRVALELITNNNNGYDIVIMDFQIAGGIMGEELIRRIKKINLMIQVIVVTKMTINMTDYEFANQLLEAGATWYCTKYPGDIEEYIYQPTDFILSIVNAFEKKKLEEDKLKSNKKINRNITEILEKKQLIGMSSTVEKLKKQVEKSAETDSNILIYGSSGTGKELVAVNIHYRSKRKYENFIPINCGSLPDNLIASELFGFEKGSFTGAELKKPGLFEIADQGTIFLDEISELPISVQSVLLRVIQEGEIDKIGRTTKIKVDVRIIAATNKNLKEEVAAGNFREDLYYRLNVVPIHVPPLKDRQQDIPYFIEHFLKVFSTDMNREVPEISPKGMKMLIKYFWPGNVRELQNVTERLLFYGDKKLSEDHVQMALGLQSDTHRINDQTQQWFLKSDSIVPWREMEKKLKKDYFEFVRNNSASDAETAKQLGLAPPNYYRMCKELGLK